MDRYAGYAYGERESVPPEIYRPDSNDFNTSERFQFLFFSPRSKQRRERFLLVIRVPDQSAEPLTISHNRISKGVESAKRLHRYLNFADDGNHARSTLQLHVSSGFCASVTLRSGVTHRGGQDRVVSSSISIYETTLSPLSAFSLFSPLSSSAPILSPRFGKLTTSPRPRSCFLTRLTIVFLIFFSSPISPVRRDNLWER